MNRQTVQNAYKDIRPDDLQKERMLETILSAASDPAAVRKDEPTMRKLKNKPLFIAAMIGLMIFLMGCAVVALNLNDLTIGEHTHTQRAYFDESGTIVPATEVTKDVISTQGIAGSKNQMAAKEWYEFAQNYDVNAAPEDFQAPRAYDAYFVYNQEMIDKVDEIAEKYGLQLAGQKEFVRIWQSAVFCDALGIGVPMKENAQAERIRNESPIMAIMEGEYEASGVIYECGNFEMHFDYNVTDEEFQWENPVYVTVRYHNKAYMAVDYYTIYDAENAEQWNYTLEDGTDVLIVNAGDAAFVFHDRKDAFITVQIDNCYYENGTREAMSKRDIELAAEVIDFSMKPRKPDMAQTVKQLEELDQIYKEKFEEWTEEITRNSTYRKKDSYKELANEAAMTYYALADLNEDGVEECLLKTVHGKSGLYTMKDGKTEVLLEDGTELYFCENNVLENYQVVGDEYYVHHDYYRLESSSLILIDRIAYDRANDEWRRSQDGDMVCEEILTKEEAEEIIASYVRADVEMKFVNELP